MKSIHIHRITGMLIIALSISGCLEYTQETETGIVTHDFIMNETVEHIDTWENGIHFTGKIITAADGISHGDIRCEIDEYVDGMHVTGTGTYQGYFINIDDIGFENDVYWNLLYEIDTYVEGIHYTGTATYQGNDPKDMEITMIGNVDTYQHGQHVTGTITITKSDQEMDTTYYNLYMAETSDYYGAVMIGYEHEGAEWKIIK